ncbi:MAG: carbohydrate-binding domain-containing protein [Lachnospiraceae bacterium]|jgi:hypothetical protein|nr:carbohydrate-binding domain-containing protein [Lachnospiraceae bacterium]
MQTLANKHIKKIILSIIVILCLIAAALTGCTNNASAGTDSQSAATGNSETTQTQKGPGTMSGAPYEEEDDTEDDGEDTATPIETISTDGEHTLTGTINGQVKVTASNVTLILQDVTINSPDGAAILGDDGKTTQELTVKLVGNNTVTAGAKHGIQGKDNLTITGSGSVNIKAEKDGIHAGNKLTIEDGTIVVEESYEGMEAPEIIVKGGNTTLFASDDGVNAATDEAGVTPSFEMTGGTLTLYSGSDGIDSNGTLSITGGTALLFINAPRDGEVFDTQQVGTTLPALDVDQSLAANSKIEILDSSGSVIWSGTNVNEATSFGLVVPGLKEGASYQINANGSSIGSFTAITSVQSMMGGGMRGGGGNWGGTQNGTDDFTPPSGGTPSDDWGGQTMPNGGGRRGNGGGGYAPGTTPEDSNTL